MSSRESFDRSTAFDEDASASSAGDTCDEGNRSR
jgi:hypothetical protein